MPDRPGTAEAAPASWLIEVLDRQNRVAQRVPVKAWPVVLGRGYGCDVIVDDPYVAARHVCIGPPDAQGALKITPLETLNGLHRVDTRKGRRGERVAGTASVQAGQWLDAGRTRWRVCRTDTPVAAERELEPYWHAPVWMIGLLLLAVGLAVGFEYWFGAYDKFEWLVGASVVFSVWGALMVWAALWGLLGRLFHAPAQFSQHLAWASAIAVIALVVPWPAATMAYALDVPRLLRWAWPLATVLGAFALLGHSVIAFGRPTRRTAYTLIAFVLVSVGMTLAGHWQSQRQLEPAGFMTEVRPPGWQWLGIGTLDEVFDSARRQRAALEALRGGDSADDAEDPD